MCKEYLLNLDSRLTDCYQLFRAETSKIFAHRKQEYRVVYLSATDFSKVTIQHNDEKKLTLIVNLQLNMYGVPRFC